MTDPVLSFPIVYLVRPLVVGAKSLLNYCGVGQNWLSIS